ncbi:hypothetical protein NDU88_004469 [Pleurodeles waltl]|uniref:Uncharacterized protein n=1 Tax=Pleurodeles waltl TaxID=8319 RepID=A0AAV7QHW3_PLEWA|nr:hypothetical protein NDU88_004469 [Pleurodeles waltl]
MVYVKSGPFAGRGLCGQPLFTGCPPHPSRALGLISPRHDASRVHLISAYRRDSVTAHCVSASESSRLGRCGGRSPLSCFKRLKVTGFAKKRSPQENVKRLFKTQKVVRTAVAITVRAAVNVALTNVAHLEPGV